MRFCKTPNLTYYDWESLLIAFKSYSTKDAAVLEIGASSEEFTLELAMYCKNLVGVELMPERLLKSKNNIVYKQGDWQKLSRVVRKNSIDVAVSKHVIEHVPDDLAAFDELYKVLKPGGVAIITTPNINRLPRKAIELFTGKKQFPDEEHVREYSEQDIEQLVKNSAFDTYEIRALTLGLHGGEVYCYLERVPSLLRKYCNFWEIHLRK